MGHEREDGGYLNTLHKIVSLGAKLRAILNNGDTIQASLDPRTSKLFDFKLSLFCAQGQIVRF